MKKQILALAIVLSSFTAMFANNNPLTLALELSPTEASFIVDLSAFEGEAEYVSIEDGYGNLVLSDNINSTKGRIKYVLNELQDGTYTVKIKGDKTIAYYVINHTGNSVSLVEMDTYSSPTIVKEANKIIVKSSNFDHTELKISIFNSNGENIYTYDGFSQKAFNLNELDSGDYRVFVRDNELSEELFVSL